MIDLDRPMMTIACAARRRDWAAIDAALADQHARCSPAVIDGFALADRLMGRDSLPKLDRPDPVTIHDLSPDERARAVIKSGVVNGQVVASSSFTLVD